MKNYAIIVAGGSGNRMQTETPKQFLLLKDLPVLMHTIKAFAQSESQPKILLVLNKDQQGYWRRLCDEFNFRIPHQVIDGGTERFHSVKNAVYTIQEEESVVAIHDAVRPLVSKTLIDNCYRAAAQQGNIIAAVQSSDSVRLFRNEKTSALKRDEIYLVQTPQTFNLKVLKEAYNQEFDSNFTDDASVVESIGHNINIIEGERSNIKITYPIDLELAELLLKP
ncbi:2-C-methyl-D-erythritol 4-phosphate cytidylyltransferase [Pedobacter sp. HDW13]|uniref:2-C-methyl-D-erythritol 4-phosphate cytidylyltransferase n=1 Tax=unclassified Pedobacter TaxID=2628915 RepID=UPI000F5B1C05|nr:MULTISPECIES: 2-C-methyl-D-erythritol 4-phosphate cytidylyltransferase [unclassified Pedobacter]QIL41733.1 2-C-methyl-D-erythritol 4-phosphate cytidylyltransferase [Pedobacter sp. HDW13]RQO73487.1 2-C-methyl-D-erythritol 4-phosphate cytidylyltransferase [Pedobacter sp. KBW01]